MFREELKRIKTWEERHRRLVARLSFIFAATAVVDVIGTVLIYLLERDADGSKVDTWFGAFFFTTTQILTVSSSLPNPVTTAGRAVDILLEMWALLVVAGSAGVFTSFVMAGDDA